MTACPQPRCIGTIVDGYCDVCGSPTVAAPFVSAAAAAAAASSTPADEPGLTAVPASTPASAPLDEAIPTQRIPAVKVPRQQVSTEEMTDRGAAAPEVIEAQQADGKKQLAEDEPDAQDYRRRVEDAQLPDEVRKAALSEVDRLERTSDQNPESGDIRTWLDTILDLPWGTKPTDWIDIQGSPEVEATLRRLIEPAVADVEEDNTAEAGSVAGDVEEGDTAEVEPAVADVEEADTAEAEPAVADVEEGNTAEAGSVAGDVEEGDTAEVEPAVADVEEADTAEAEPAVADVEEADASPAGPEHDDTARTPTVPSVLGRGQHQHAQLPVQTVLGPEPVQTPAKKGRFGSVALAAIALLALLIGALFFAASRDGSVTAQLVPTVTATTTVSKPTSKPSDKSTNTEGKESIIQLDDLAESGRPFQPVRIHGTYRGGADTFLHVQRWEGGKWLALPLPTKTDQAGQFTTYVELGQPGRYQLRMLDPDSGVTSKTFVLVIKG
jgi:hypothetical protein